MSLIRTASIITVLVLHRIIALKSRLEYLEEIPIEEAPYIAIVLCSNSKYFCTGTILQQRWVLTAAHCFYDMEGRVTEDDTTVFVVAGTSRLNDAAKDIKSGVAQIRQSEAYLVHEGYHFSENFILDLALIILQEPFEMTNRTLLVLLNPIYPIYMAEHSGASGSSVFSCTMTGFGKVYLNDSNVNDNSLKKQTVNVGKDCFCLNMVWSLRSQNNVLAGTNNFICEDGGGDPGLSTLSGLCSGDQGAPLICDNGLRAIGTTVFHYKDREECLLKKDGPNECGSHQTMSVFTDLCPVSQWLSFHVPGFPVVDDSCEPLIEIYM